jgi:hypothetical protein
MSIQIIKRRKRHEGTEYTRSYDYKGERDWGFSFECDSKGKVDRDALDLATRLTFLECCEGFTNGRPVVYRGVESRDVSWTEPAVGLCDCGAEVVLGGFTCPCDCGRDYNSAGQLLAPREQWGEETGESLSDILSIS